jgi:hypothetical protein
VKLETILAELKLAVDVAADLGIPAAGPAAKISDALFEIAQTAIKAHQDILGQPIDLNLLKPIDKVD